MGEVDGCVDGLEAETNRRAAQAEIDGRTSERATEGHSSGR
jgi:hypothetical protein